MDPTAERNAVLGQLEKAVAALTPPLSRKLIPPSGAQIAYAIRGARDTSGIAAVGGRIIATKEAVKTGGPCSFGTDDEIARILLTVMKFDPCRRSAALLLHSDRALDVLDGDLFLECVAYDAARAPNSISTMDWGIASCCRNEVPDVIYAKGDKSDNVVLVLLGEDPVDVANNIIMCSNRI
jgi:hydroxymethylpyrimidine/phosphomethylpyrimidine kinase